MIRLSKNTFYHDWCGDYQTQFKQIGFQKKTTFTFISTIRFETRIYLFLLTYILGVCATLEQLPNELFFFLFTYLDIQDLYKAFWGLNARLNSLFQSYENLSITFDKKTDQLSMRSYAPHITRLIIDTPTSCDFTQFPNLQSLILCDGNSSHQKQIQPDIVPNLTRLSFLLGSTFGPTAQLVSDVFSNRFPSLRYANLGRVQNLTAFKSPASPSLRFLSIRSDAPLIVSCVLAACPNLDHLQLHIFNKIRTGVLSSPAPRHPLRRFTLWSDSVQLTSTDIDILLANTPNVQHFYLQTVCNIPFIDLANGLVNRLNRLSRFDCHIKEVMTKHSRVGDFSALHRLHPCFNGVECKEEKDDFRIFATK
jgi:hypothetical protein